MSNIDLRKLMTEASPHKALLAQTRGLVSKWEKSGLLEGLDETRASGMAVLLENQATELLSESSVTSPTNAAGNEEWAGVALPLVRKVFGEIASQNFVSVQPMNLPAGLVFYMDFQYGTTKGSRTSDAASGFQSSVYGDTTSSVSPTGGLYGPGTFGYTINNATASFAAVATSSAAVSSSVNFTSGIQISGLAEYAIPKTHLSGSDLSAIKAFTISGSNTAGALTGLLPEFTRLSGANVVFVANSAVTSPTVTSVTYSKQPDNTTRGDFEDRTGTLAIPEIDLELVSQPIVAKTRKLKAVWTPELAQDLNAYHSIDAEAELTAMLSEYISLEIDLEILDMLIVNAQTVDYWSAQIGNIWNGSAFAASTNISGQAWTNMTWFQTLGQKIQRVSNRIHTLTMRGGANFLVCSPDVATILETIPGFQAGTDGDKMKFAAGVSQIGSFQSRYQVYKNPYMQSNIVLLGYRGSNFLETGAVYAPYVPLIMTPLIYDPNTFTPRRGVMTRYAKKMVRPEFFAKIYVADMNTV
jgi:hypothetical protein